MAANQPKSPPPSNAQRARSFLLYGFLISIALHLFAGPLVKFQRSPEAKQTVLAVRIDKVPTPPPTPPPTPKPTPTPPPTPPPKETPPPVKHTPEPEQPKIKINTAKSTTTKGTGSEHTNTHTEGSTNGVPRGTTTAPAATAVPVATAAPATPTPAPTPTKPACATPNVAPKVVNASPPETPAIAQQQNITGEVEVIVSLDATSKLVGPPTISKTVSAVLNAAAIRSARESTYQTEIQNCLPIAAKYRFVVEFSSQ